MRAYKEYFIRLAVIILFNLCVMGLVWAAFERKAYSAEISVQAYQEQVPGITAFQAAEPPFLTAPKCAECLKGRAAAPA